MCDTYLQKLHETKASIINAEIAIHYSHLDGNFKTFIDDEYLMENSKKNEVIEWEMTNNAIKDAEYFENKFLSKLGNNKGVKILHDIHKNGPQREYNTSLKSFKTTENIFNKIFNMQYKTLTEYETYEYVRKAVSNEHVSSNSRKCTAYHVLNASRDINKINNSYQKLSDAEKNALQLVSISKQTLKQLDYAEDLLNYVRSLKNKAKARRIRLNAYYNIYLIIYAQTKSLNEEHIHYTNETIAVLNKNCSLY